MIAIVNCGPYDDPNPLGVRTYEVRINSEVITTFKHARGDGLAECLRKAANAVAAKHWQEVEQLCQSIGEQADAPL